LVQRVDMSSCMINMISSWRRSAICIPIRI